MASGDNGKQRITFKYQQEGTAEGFNKLLLGVLPYGIISGNNITADIANTRAVISRGTEFLIGDGNTLIHVALEEEAYVPLDRQHPYITGTFNWANTTNNYVGFEAKAYNEIQDNMLVFARMEFIGDNLQSSVDYTRTSWSSAHYNHNFLYATPYNTFMPSFYVAPTENVSTVSFDVNKGEAIINGKKVVKNNFTTVELSNDYTSVKYFNASVNYGRVDLLVMNSDGNFEYIMGEDKVDPIPRIIPRNKLALAKITLPSGTVTNNILGSQIENIYNNNYMSFGSTRGEWGMDSTNNPILRNEHTLYL